MFDGLNWIKAAYAVFLVATLAFVAFKIYATMQATSSATAAASGFRARQKVRFRGNLRIIKWIGLFLLIHWPLLRFMGALSKTTAP